MVTFRGYTFDQTVDAVADLGADNTGSNDVSTALEGASPGDLVLLPDGDYKFTDWALLDPTGTSKPIGFVAEAAYNDGTAVDKTDPNDTYDYSHDVTFIPSHNDFYFQLQGTIGYLVEGIDIDEGGTTDSQSGGIRHTADLETEIRNVHQLGVGENSGPEIFTFGGDGGDTDVWIHQMHYPRLTNDPSHYNSAAGRMGMQCGLDGPTGTLHVVGGEISEGPNNGIYHVNTTVNLEVRGTRFENNNVSHVRTAGDNLVEDCTFVADRSIVQATAIDNTSTAWALRCHWLNPAQDKFDDGITTFRNNYYKIRDWATSGSGGGSMVLIGEADAGSWEMIDCDIDVNVTDNSNPLGKAWITDKNSSSGNDGIKLQNVTLKSSGMAEDQHVRIENAAGSSAWTPDVLIDNCCIESSDTGVDGFDFLEDNGTAYTVNLQDTNINVADQTYTTTGSVTVNENNLTTTDTCTFSSGISATSTLWTGKITEAGDKSSFEITTTTSIPAGADVGVTVYEDVDNDGTGSKTDALGNSYDNSAGVTLAGGTDETNTLQGFDGGGTTNAYWVEINLSGDGAVTTDSPTVSGVTANPSADLVTDAGSITSASGSTLSTSTTGVITDSGTLTAGSYSLFTASETVTRPPGSGSITPATPTTLTAAEDGLVTESPGATRQRAETLTASPPGPGTGTIITEGTADTLTTSTTGSATDDGSITPQVTGIVLPEESASSTEDPGETSASGNTLTTDTERGQIDGGLVTSSSFETLTTRTSTIRTTDTANDQFGQQFGFQFSGGGAEETIVQDAAGPITVDAVTFSISSPLAEDSGDITQGDYTPLTAAESASATDEGQIRTRSAIPLTAAESATASEDGLVTESPGTYARVIADATGIANEDPGATAASDSTLTAPLPTISDSGSKTTQSAQTLTASIEAIVTDSAAISSSSASSLSVDDSATATLTDSLLIGEYSTFDVEEEVVLSDYYEIIWRTELDTITIVWEDKQ